MIKIVKILNSQKHVELLKVKSVKNDIKMMVNEFVKYQLPFICKNEVDYLKLAINYQSLKQKMLIEDSYEELRASWNEVWYDLDYKQKNKFASEAFDKIKNDFKFFYYNDKIVYIPFFDTLINALYDHEMAVFELPQFYKLFNDFKGQFNDISNYGLLPLIHGFSPMEYLFDSENGVYLLSHVNKVVYIINQDYKCQKIAFENVDDKDALVEALKIYDQSQAKQLMEYLVASNLISDKIRKKLNKILVKGKYE